MRCPKCKATLVKGKPKRYETLLEHVSDPNQKLLLRPTYICLGKCLGANQFSRIYYRYLYKKRTRKEMRSEVTIKRRYPR